MSQKAVDFDLIVKFLQKNFRSILIFAATAIGISLVVIVAAYLFLPQKELYVSKITLQLQKQDNLMIYPSGKPFSANDIISTPILRQIYSENGLENRIEFPDFCKLFSFTSLNMEKELLAAKYREKLNDKKLSVIDLMAIEKEYLEEARNLDNSELEIAMSKDLVINEQEVLKILHSIPAYWADLYSKQEAKIFPRAESPAQIQAFYQNAATNGSLITLDKSRIACANLLNSCDDFMEILAGQKVTLPSGESLEDLKSQLTLLDQHRIQPYLLLIQKNPALRSPLDELFLQSRLATLDLQINTLKSKYDSVVAAINILHPRDNIMDKAPLVNADSTPVTMNVDNNFLQSISELIRNSSSIAIREKYAAEALKYKNELAKLEAEKKYYSEKLSTTGKNPGYANAVSVDLFKRMQNTMIAELLLICGKVNQFREIIIRDYFLNKSFFVTSGEIQKISEFYVPFGKLAVTIIFITIMIIICNIGKKFYLFYSETADEQ